MNFLNHKNIYLKNKKKPPCITGILEVERAKLNIIGKAQVKIIAKTMFY